MWLFLNNRNFRILISNIYKNSQFHIFSLVLNYNFKYYISQVLPIFQTSDYFSVFSQINSRPISKTFNPRTNLQYYLEVQMRKKSTKLTYLKNYCFILRYFKKYQSMLAHTMHKLNKARSTTPHRFTSNTPNSYNIYSKPTLYSTEQNHPHLTNISPSTLMTSPRSGLITPIRSQSSQEEIPLFFTSNKREYIESKTDTKIPSSGKNSTFTNFRTQSNQISPFRETSTQETWKTDFRNANSIVDGKVVSSHNNPKQYQTKGISSLFKKDNNEIANYIKQIQSLRQQLSESFSDKLSLQLKLNKYIQNNKDLQLQIGQLQNDLQSEYFSKKKENHSFTLQTQNQAIIQLLDQYKDMKKVIEKLMEDNEQLIKKNQQLVSGNLVQNEEQNIQELYTKILKLQDEKMNLNQYIRTLLGSLQEQKKEKYAVLKQNQLYNEERRQHHNTKHLVSQLKSQVQNLKSQLKISTKQNNQKAEFESQLRVVQLTKEVEQLSLMLSDKDSQIQQLTSEVQYLQNKLKQVLGELRIFTEVFESEKKQIIKEFEAHKLASREQISSLKKQLSNKVGKQLGSSGAGTVYIEVSDLKQTSTRISGGYEQVILGQKPPVPVVASYRAVSGDILVGYQ